MKNNLSALILNQQALDNELLEAVQAEFVLMMEDLLKKGANPNFIPNDFRRSLSSHILYWYGIDEIELAVKVLFAHNYNPNIDMPENGSILRQLRERKAEFMDNMTTQTLIFSAEQSQQFIDKLTALEPLLLQQGATPLVPLKTGRFVPYFRRGHKNPEPILENSFFHIITEHLHPYDIRKNLNITLNHNLYIRTKSSKNTNEPPPEQRLWNYHRFGTSRTLLPGGSIVFIGGEHEDYYDPDFCIFNDVLRIDKTGKMQLFFYPEAAFKPTDFHTATYFDNHIIIIGNLGYTNDRSEQETQVYKLRLSDYSIEKMWTMGDNPKWISRHSAFVHEGKIVVWGGKIWSEKKYEDNPHIYSLNPKSGIWENHGAFTKPE